MRIYPPLPKAPQGDVILRVSTGVAEAFLDIARSSARDAESKLRNSAYMGPDERVALEREANEYRRAQRLLIEELSK